MRGLAGQESQGTADPSSAVNPHTGAHGEWQVMPANWSSWAKEAGLPANAPKTAENQRKVVRHKLVTYFVKWGDWDDVARAWYSGPAHHDRRSDVRENGGKYPSINSYAAGVLKKTGTLPCSK